jgi:hypothetical protein
LNISCLCPLLLFDLLLRTIKCSDMEVLQTFGRHFHISNKQ